MPDIQVYFPRIDMGEGDPPPNNYSYIPSRNGKRASEHPIFPKILYQSLISEFAVTVLFFSGPKVGTSM